MDYDLEIILIALVAHQQFEGSNEDDVSTYATQLFKRFDKHIRAAGEAAGQTLDARQRSVIASMAAMVGGPARDAAKEAVASYVNLFAS